MLAPKILVMAGSLRAGSFNARLAALAAKEFARAEADVSRISFADYPLPLFDADLLGGGGMPGKVLELRRMVGAHQGVFIASPEYSASVPPLIKNAIDWISRAAGYATLGTCWENPVRAGSRNPLLSPR